VLLFRCWIGRQCRLIKWKQQPIEAVFYRQEYDTFTFKYISNSRKIVLYRNALLALEALDGHSDYASSRREFFLRHIKVSPSGPALTWRNTTLNHSLAPSPKVRHLTQALLGV